MPSFKIEELEQSVVGSALNTRLKAESGRQTRGKAVGQVREDRRRTPEESERLIREFIYKQKKPALFLDICDALDRKPSALLRALVNDMVARKVLVKTEHPSIAGNIPTYKYSRPK